MQRRLCHSRSHPRLAALPSGRLLRLIRSSPCRHTRRPDLLTTITTTTPPLHHHHLQKAPRLIGTQPTCSCFKLTYLIQTSHRTISSSISARLTQWRPSAERCICNPGRFICSISADGLLDSHTWSFRFSSGVQLITPSSPCRASMFLMICVCGPADLQAPLAKARQMPRDKGKFVSSLQACDCRRPVF